MFFCNVDGFVFMSCGCKEVETQQTGADTSYFGSVPRGKWTMVFKKEKVEGHKLKKDG